MYIIRTRRSSSKKRRSRRSSRPVRLDVEHEASQIQMNWIYHKHQETHAQRERERRGRGVDKTHQMPAHTFPVVHDPVRRSSHFFSRWISVDFHWREANQRCQVTQKPSGGDRSKWVKPSYGSTIFAGVGKRDEGTRRRRWDGCRTGIGSGFSWSSSRRDNLLWLSNDEEDEHRRGRMHQRRTHVKH